MSRRSDLAGSLLGVGEYIKAYGPHISIVAVQAARGTRLPGTASLDDGDYTTPFIAKGFGERIFDRTIKVHESDAIRRALQLRDQGIFCGPQTGGLLEAALQVMGSEEIRGETVLLSGDSGWKNLECLLGWA